MAFHIDVRTGDSHEEKLFSTLGGAVAELLRMLDRERAAGRIVVHRTPTTYDVVDKSGKSIAVYRLTEDFAPASVPQARAG